MRARLAPQTEDHMSKLRPAAWAAGAVSFACVLALAGCSLFGPSPEQIVREGLSSDLDTLVDAESQAHQAMVSSLESSGALSGLNVGAGEFVDALLDGFTYVNEEVVVDDEGTTAVATVNVTCKSLTDIATRAQELLNQRFAEADATAVAPEQTLVWMGECVMQAADEDEPEPVELELTCTSDEDGTWAADSSVADAVATALLGAS